MGSFDVSAITSAFTRFEGLPNIASVKDKLLNYYLASSVYGKPLPGHFVFTGVDSSNMNQVARTLGEVLKELGMLTSGHTVECVKEDLVSPYVGESVNKTRKLCNKALDGVLVVHEAFALVSDNYPSHRFTSMMDEEAYTELLVFMENNRDRICVIFTGLPGTMDAFVNANPGMKSRIALSIVFPTESTNDAAINNTENLEAAVDPVVTLDALFDELNSLVGMDSVKEQVARIVKQLVVFGERVVPGPFVFVGNPGTGKSLVAHILGKILKAIGVLKSGHVVTVRRSDLVAGYVGQTAIKTTDLCKKALDGVLFVDEAYSLCPRTPEYDFGLEALDAIWKFREDNRDRVCVIFAGYEEAMRKFMEINAGFESHIAKTIHFPGYSSAELTEIFVMRAKEEGFTLSNEALETVKIAFAALTSNKRGMHGNAREVRRLFEQCKERIASRMVELIKAGKLDLVDQEKYCITKDDIPTIPVEPEASSCHGRISAHEWAKLQNEIGQNAVPINHTSSESVTSSSRSTNMVWVEDARYYGAKRVAESGKAEECGKIPAKVFCSLSTSCLDNVVNNWVSLSQATASAILYLKTDTGTGTAFLISPDGYALTCNHIISSANKIEARFRMSGRAGGSDSWHNCKVINTKADLDIALIKLDGENFPCLSLVPEGRVIQKGEEFILSGYPLSKRMAKDLTTFRGYVASTEKQTDDNGFIRYDINCDAKSGNSGAPIIALSDGRVIGVFLGSVTENTNGILGEEINYMRPIQYFWEEFVD